MAKWTFRTFLKEQCTNGPPLHVKLTGKTVLVVGANAGIGFEAALHFAKMDPGRLILACRNEEKGTKAVSVIEEATGYRAELMLVDLADFASVVEFAAKLDGDSVDILAANAGIVNVVYRTTGDGWEESLKVNHLSTALISFLLLPNLRRAAAEHGSTSRLVIVTSEMHHFGKFDEEVLAAPGLLQALNQERYCTPKVMNNRYPISKLLNVLFTRALPEQQTESNSSVIITTVNPGFCITDVRRNMGLGDRVGGKLMEWTVARTAEQGARQLLWAALGPDGTDGPQARALNGAYVSAASVCEPSDWVVSKEGHDVQERIWVETIDILSKVAPSLSGILGSNA